MRMDEAERIRALTERTTYDGLEVHRKRPAKFGWWSPAVLIVRVIWLNPREEEVLQETPYRWRWLAELMNPKGFHFRTILGRSCFIEFAVVPA